ncbi:putative nuclease HARBI1 [Lineus longissimus]|uniref:putative nuclease HARBI1 n=1 Tax=Lineus longissimus TaxID=88925 RepID=UPI00315D3BE1
MDRFITWPDMEEVNRVKLDFYNANHHRFPCITGLIDGTQVEVNTPHRPYNEAAYVNRKGYHAINAQVVCDRKMKIFNLDARWPGTTHDSFMLRNSHVWDRFEEGRMENSWLLGDAGYPLRKWLLNPFNNPNNEAQERVRLDEEYAKGMFDNQPNIQAENDIWEQNVAGVRAREELVQRVFTRNA